MSYKNDADMTIYINSFYDNDKLNRKQYLETDATPVKYKGFLIYHRTYSIFDIVKDGICIGMYAGLNGAKGRIDTLILDNNE